MEIPEQSDRVERVERGRVSAQELSWALRATNRAAADVDHALAVRIGLRDLDYAAMGHVMSQDRTPLGPAELGHRLGISTGSATELADRLERAGHIYRSRDGMDRRRVSLLPNDDTVARILAELKPLFDSLDALATDFSEEEQLVIARYLRAATQQLSRYAENISSARAAERKPKPASLRDF